MKLNKTIRTALAMMLAMAVTLTAAGCGSGEEAAEKPYDYNLEEYVTVGEYKGLEYTAFEVEVTDEEVEEAIEEVLAEYMTKEEVTQGAVKSGDFVKIKYTMEVDGEAVNGTDAQSYTVKVGDNGLMPAVDQALIGAEVGEKLTVETTFAEDYDINPEYAGKAVKYEIEIENISVPIYQELTDEFAKETLGVKNAAEYRELVKETLYQNELAEARYAAGEEIWKQVVEEAEVLQYPEAEVTKTAENMEKNLISMMEQSGMTLEQGLAEVLEMTQEEFDAEIHKSAEAGVKEELILYTIARKHDLEMSEKEIQEYMERLLAANSMTDEEFTEQYGADIRTYMEDGGVLISMLYEEVFGFLVDEGVAK